jgi:hypothetical protein
MTEPLAPAVLIDRDELEALQLAADRYLKSERVSRWVGYTNGRHRTRYLHFAGAKNA